MNRGKDICNQLKELRRQIACDNDIELDIPECTYKGDCDGTCPRCDAELRFLEQELSRRSLLGKAAMVAGVAFTVAASPTVMAQEAVAKQQHATRQVENGTFSVSVTLTDEAGEALTGAYVFLAQKGEILYGARTDFDGVCHIRNVKEGIYDFSFSYVGYNRVDTTLEVRKDMYIQQALVQSSDSIRTLPTTPLIMGKPAVIRERPEKDGCDSDKHYFDELEIKDEER